MLDPPLWLAAYGGTPTHLDYPPCSVHHAVMATVDRVALVARALTGATLPET